MLQMKPDHHAFFKVCKALEDGRALTIQDITNVFGWPAMELFLLMATPQMNSAVAEMLDKLKKELDG